MARPCTSLSALCTKYEETCSVKKKTGKQDVYRINKYIIPYFGKRTRVSDIDYEKVYNFHESLSSTPYLANRLLALLKNILNMSILWKFVEKDFEPCKYVKYFREYKRRRIPSANELEEILKHLKSEPHTGSVLFINLLLFTGARPSEIEHGLRANIKNNILTLKEHKTDNTGEPKEIYIPDFCLSMIRELRTPNDGSITGIKSPRKLWDKIRVKVGCVDLRLRDLRRHFASIALNNGASLDQIGEILGHNSTQTTKSYAWMLESVAKVIVENVSQSIAESI